MIDIVTTGSWTIPAIITLAAFGFAILLSARGNWDYDVRPPVGCALIPIAGCVSLAAWLIWSLAA